MKVSPGLKVLALLGAAFVFGNVRAGAQDFGLTVTGSAGTIIVSNSLTYTINVTNQTGLLLPNVFVTNALPASVEISSATSSQGTASADGSVVTFFLGQMFSGGSAQLTLTVQPTAFGFITNVVTAASDVRTNIVTTNIVTPVISAQADLGVAVTAPASGIFTNDWIVYGVTVTNGGPDSAPGVILSNALPDGVGLISVSPTNRPFTLTNSTVLFALGTLTNGGSITLGLTVQVTNAGTLTFSSSVSAAGVLDTNSVNDTASTNITVGNYLAGQLTATNASAMTYIPQTGLMNQTVRLSNVGTSAVASVRLIVSGLTNWLYDAVGTNNGNPFVVYGTTLNTNQSVDLTLEYFVPTRLPVSIPDSAYAALEVPASSLPVPSGTSVPITRIKQLASGNVLIEFPSVLGSSYTILYSDNVSFSNTLVARPANAAPANRVQWIDYGPPKTLSAPPNTPSRFYRVLQNP